MTVVKKFQQAIKTHAMLKPGDRVVLGVSGGADSLSMLHLFLDARESLGVSITVLHVHHGIRGAEADADAAFVKATCRDWKVPCRVAKINVPALAKKQKLTLEEAARIARYTALYGEASKRGASSIAVAHNADDQAETVLMHLLRGSGMAGLRGMLPVQANPPIPVDSAGQAVSLIRPLLNIPHSDIDAYCAENDLTPRLDATNRDMAYLRNRIRREVMPILESINPNVRDALSRASTILSDDYDFLESQIDAAFQLAVRVEEKFIHIERAGWLGLRPSLQRGVIRRAVHALTGGAGDLSFEHIEQAAQVARTGRTGAEATLPGKLVLRVGYGKLTMGEVSAMAEAAVASHEPLLDRGAAIPLSLPCDGVILLGGWHFSLTPYAGPVSGGRWQQVLAERWAAPMSISAETVRKLQLRTRKPGDRFQPQGVGGTQKLSDFMINAKIESELRDRTPMFVVDSQIAWVCGWRVDQRFIVTPDSKEVWLARFVKP